ncbi:hypothetical protein [Novosphingobium sp.]|uniref:hypothetical protein n=1 Tax=Novosphingobium sp. TaxID=1874826 RepID=UPI003565CCFB
MGEYADYEIHRMIDSWGWSGRRWKARRPAPKPKPTNQQIFSSYAAPIHGMFKTGDRVVHQPSGVAGTVWATRAGQISWRPDSRIKPGAIWSDADKFLHEGF